MHTYRKIKDGNDRLFVVGIWEPESVGESQSRGDFTRAHWNAIRDFLKEDEAAAYASYLNGGAKR